MLAQWERGLEPKGSFYPLPPAGTNRLNPNMGDPEMVWPSTVGHAG